jgi:hypothetical protein
MANALLKEENFYEKYQQAKIMSARDNNHTKTRNNNYLDSLHSKSGGTASS